MTDLFGLAGIDASEFQFARNVDKSLLYDAVTDFVAHAVEETRMAQALFVQGTTEKITEKYKLPMRGRMSKIKAGASPTPRTVVGAWDVGYDLENHEDMFQMTDVDFNYMTPDAFNNHIVGIVTIYQDTLRYEILRHLFNNTTLTFADDRFGDISVRPLANGDSAVYPPAVGGSTERTALQQYLASGYASSAISDVNDPIKTLKALFVANFGVVQGGSNVIALINPNQEDKISALTDFIATPKRDVSRASDTEYTVGGLQRLNSLSAEVIGSLHGVDVATWSFIPEDYILAVDGMNPAPLKQRVDLSGTGLGSGALQLMESGNHAGQMYNRWRARMGFGVANRLNGAVMHLTAGSYTVPSDYSWA